MRAGPSLFLVTETPSAAACCIWCGQRLEDAPDAASFLFLARRGEAFTASPGDWAERSEHLEGHQFFCHAACFRSSVPGPQQYGLRLALDEAD